MKVNTDKCKHPSWMIEKLHGATIMARCRECGAEAEFHEDSDSYEYIVVTKPRCTRESFVQHDPKEFCAESEHVAEQSN